jgi:aspartyl protease family protein
MNTDPLMTYFTKNPRLSEFLKNITVQYREKLPDELLFDVLMKDTASIATATIPMKARGGGVYEISCKVNELKLSFIFDTGASDISISQTEASFMLKNGYLQEQDILGTRQYLNANGMIDEGTRVLLKKVDFGGLILNNVTASVVNSKTAPLLFGQSALAKYARIVIDNAKGEITITKNK